MLNCYLLKELVQNSTHYVCKGQTGNYFFVNPLAFSGNELKQPYGTIKCVFFSGY